MRIKITHQVHSIRVPRRDQVIPILRLLHRIDMTVVCQLITTKQPTSPAAIKTYK